MKNKKLWLGLGLVFVVSFGVLIRYGVEIYREAPPIPDRVVSESGELLATGDDIRGGQNVWQALGGQELGSIWGHGAYVAPDWSTDWLHREATLVTGFVAGASGEGTAQAVVRLFRSNTYDPATKTLTLAAPRAAAFKELAVYYGKLFGDDAAMTKLRADYAMPSGLIRTDEDKHQFASFIFWSAWSCAAERPGLESSYTNNWPGEELVGNRPTGSIVLWSILSVIALLLGVAALAWYRAFKGDDEPAVTPPAADPFRSLALTPSQRATLPYFLTVIALFVVQLGLGMLTAHYGVEGDGFFGIPLQKWLPYQVLRTWHTQAGIFWIATAWLGTGLFVAPAVSGKEPKFQKAGVLLLWVCLLIIVVGSFAGQWFSVMGKLGRTSSFWFGHQGYEYVDLGRFWQIFLFAGLFIWLGLMVRALLPALKSGAKSRQLTALFTISAAAIGLFYGAGLMWGQHTHLSMVEYWRWWVVHLWVEGFFEVFATVVAAFIFTRLGLIDEGSATRASIFSSAIFLGGGIIGTFHHLYFTGTPTAVLAWGSVFSALEVVPLVLVGFEAYGNYKVQHTATWVQRYRYPILFLVSVSFWNLVGAGLLGFLINTPLALYHFQGLNLTPLHGHTALFGVYGMLGIGMMLFALRWLEPEGEWNEKLLKVAFWGTNGGLAAMSFLSLLPIGITQGVASIEHGMYYARSPEFMQGDTLQLFRWLRVPGDILFTAGAIAIALVAAGVVKRFVAAGRARG